jgi:hypothetical protein
MSLIRILLERQRTKYQQLKPFAKGAIAPRLGYYLIQNIEYKKVDEIEIPIATALWTDNPQFFIEGECLEIQLFSLNQKASKAHTPIDIDELKGKVVEVIDSGILQQTPGGGHRYWVEWDVSREVIPVLTAQQLALKFITSADGLSSTLINSLDEWDDMQTVEQDDTSFYDDLPDDTEEDDEQTSPE